MECQFCNAILKNKYSLVIHQKKAKYCLIKQGKSNDKYKCEYCDKTLSTKQHLEVHYISCSQKKIQDSLSTNSQKYTSKILDLEKDNKYLRDEIKKQQNNHKNEINILKSQIEKLQDKLENIALQAVKRPMTTNKTQINNFIQNMEPITREKLVEYTPQLTLEHIQKGASGYAEYALEYPLKDRLVCVDYSRRKIKFKNKDGDLISDPEMTKLTPMFFESIKAKSSEIVYSQNDPNMDSVMFEQVAKLFNTNADVKNGADGIKSDFYHDFVKHVCSGSMVES